MASTTTNIGLTKPAGTDQALISAINGNMDIIDTKMGAVGNTSVQSQITSLSDQITSQTISVSSLANFESQLNTLISSMSDGQTKDIIYSPASAFSPFKDAMYSGNVQRTSSTIATVYLTRNQYIVKGYYSSGSWTWTDLYEQIENKANGGGVSWGTSFTVNLSKNVGYLFVNNDLRIQIWLTGEGIAISSSYNSGTNVYGFTKSVTGNTITFSGTDPNGNAFTITKNGSTITITKSTAGAMLIVC